MDIGAILVIVAMAVLVIGYITRPFISGRSRSKKSASDNFSHLLAERDRLMTAILELEFDNELGKVPEDVYSLQREDLSTRTIIVMKELDEKRGGDEELIKEEIKKPSRHKVDDIERMIALRKSSKSNNKTNKFCSECGNEIQTGDKFCMGCGEAL